MKVLIKDIPVLERPRERFINFGVNSLTNEELISIVLKTGFKDYSVKDVSNNILKELKDITDLREISINELIKIKGIGKVKAITLLSAIELGKRVYQDKRLYNYKINSSKDIYNYIKDKLKYKKQEYFIVLYLDSKNIVIDSKTLFKGTLDKASVHPREIFKYAYINSSKSIILIHNHPSNNTFPSKDDIILTKNIIDIGKIMGIKVIDHVIVGNNNYYSLYDNNDI